MKILLDTNIIIHREAEKMRESEIGQLFYWIDKLKFSKYIHPLSIKELEKFNDSNASKAMSIKIESYNSIKHQATQGELIQSICSKLDSNENDVIDTQLLNEIFEKRIDFLISEDKKIHTKAKLLGISDKVFKIQTFLEKATSENPELVSYKVLAVRKVDFGDLNCKESFFDSFRNDYEEFDAWFNKKTEESCYVCYEDENIIGFLYIKIELFKDEDYGDISPSFDSKKRLKIGTLKVSRNGYKIGERFLKVVFENANAFKVDEIYVTIFNKRPEQEQLIEMLEEWGFIKHGIKKTKDGEEDVYVRKFSKLLPANINFPKMTFPFFSADTNKYIIKIKSEYHTELLPDSINTREDISKYIDNEPHRNRISKVYISHSKDRSLKAGDILIFYRIGDTNPKMFSSTITTICIVEGINDSFKNFDEFYACCNRKTMISKEELLNDWWNKYPNTKPFIINFLNAHIFPTPKPTLNDLINIGIFASPLDIPQGFIKLSSKKFDDIVKFAYSKKR